MAVLLVEKGKQKGLRFEVPDDAAPTVLGRDQSADIVLDDERASRLHAQVRRRRGRWALEDLQSRNGILHRGRSVRELVLEDGETFQIGSTFLIFSEAERVDPFPALEIQGARLSRLLADEAGVLVYQAYQPALDRPVRVDILHPRLGSGSAQPDAARPGATDMAAIFPFLKAAAEAAVEVDHPQVNPLVRAELPDERGSGFAMLRWCDARPLPECLPELLRLPFPVRLRCFRRLAEEILARKLDALGYPLGLRHILLDPQDGPMIQALELSALVALLRGQAADLPAFPAYLAPEQAAEKAAPSPPAAIYNLGALGYHLLTRSPPMGEGSVEEILERHAKLPPAPADLSCSEVPEPVARILSAMLEKDPARRPAAPDVLKELASAPSQPGSGKVLPAGDSPSPAGSPPRPAAVRTALPAAAPASSRAGPAPPRAPGPVSPKAAAPPPRKVPLLLHLFFWPLLWSGLFFGARELIKIILDRAAAGGW